MRNHLISLVLLFTNSSTPPVDAVRISLEAASEKWFRWLLISSGIVALGCILEIGETWTDLRRWTRFRRSLHVESEDQTSWLVPVGAAGLLLVILGVIGEGVFEGLVSNADTALRAYNNTVLFQAQKDAGDAKDSALKAATAADTANRAADASQRKADALAKQTSALELRLGSASSRLQSIEKRLAWRTLTKEQKELLKTDLSKLPTLHLEMKVLLNDIEAQVFAEELSTFLEIKDIGWTVNRHLVMMTPTPVGLIFEVPSTDRFTGGDPRFSVKKLIDDLNALGISSDAELDTNLKKGEVVLVVGVKPQKAP